MIVIGPGLGRDDRVLRTIGEVIVACREMKKPLIIDADGLFVVSQKPDLIKDYPNLILTPNAIEFSRLAKAVIDKTIQPSPVSKVSDVKHVADVIDLL